MGGTRPFDFVFGNSSRFSPSFHAEDVYLVQSSDGDNKTYEVTLSVAMCTCWSGRTGKACKHQVWVAAEYGSALRSLPPVSAADRAKFYFVAMGQEPRTGWLDDLHQHSTPAPSSALALPPAPSTEMEGVEDDHQGVAAQEAFAEEEWTVSIQRTCSGSKDYRANNAIWPQRLTLVHLLALMLVLLDWREFHLAH